MTHTYSPQVTNQKETHHVDSLISDKPDSNMYRYIDRIDRQIDRWIDMQRLTCTHHAAPEMRSYTQIEGQSTQGLDKQTLHICMHIS